VAHKDTFSSRGQVSGKSDLTAVIDAVWLEVEGEVATTWRRLVKKSYRRESVPYWLRLGAVRFDATQPCHQQQSAPNHYYTAPMLSPVFHDILLMDW
jgi:hypothetical protein